MTDDTSRPARGPSDPADYSASKAPETQEEAEEQHPHPRDMRLIPGGARAAAADPGMSSLDREATPHGGRTTGQQDIGRTGSEK